LSTNRRSSPEYAKAKNLTTRERLELFAKVCAAVHHGHQKGIIHRDLKPGNILVDSHGEPKVIDFGVARATDSDMAVTTLQTDVGQLIGTLQYMSPEQCDADPHDLDTRSDVYALGVVLYELLCEQLPYDVTKVAVYEAARVIRLGLFMPQGPCYAAECSSWVREFTDATKDVDQAGKGAHQLDRSPTFRLPPPTRVVC
jgi:serine/threonine protein kinase